MPYDRTKSWTEKPFYFDRPATAAMVRFLDTEAGINGRVVALSIEPDGIFIYTVSAEWCDDAGSGTFRADSETAAIKKFYARVRRNGESL